MNATAKKLSVHFMPGDGKGWALDEDQRQMRAALKGIVQERSLAQAEIVHTPFWQGLSAIAPAVLKEKFVIAHADNPPFFYLKQPDFSWGQQVVDLWIARSQEAFEQFQALKLPVKYIPYTIDAKLFFPLEDKKALRKKFHLPEEAYIIANFHRDSEGSDLHTPKTQKAPELFLAILKELQHRGHSFHVLLAGPRRHWLRAALAKEGMSFTFVGKETEADDFGINILKRSELNELINAADLYVIPSRWEGGPQSVMEAAACRCKILSTPLGVAKDILEPTSLYHSVEEAVTQITNDQETNVLATTVQPQWEAWYRSHTTTTLQEGLQQLYKNLPERLPQKNNTASVMTQYRQQGWHVLQRWTQKLKGKPRSFSIGYFHELGNDGDLDYLFLNLTRALQEEKIKQHSATGAGLEIIGWPSEKLPPRKKNGYRLQWIVPSMQKEHLLPDALLIAPSVQDVLNLRAAGCFQPVIVLPWPMASGTSLSEEPFVVLSADKKASLDVSKAMNVGRPIVYPSHSAYYEQVFHAGISFSTEEALPQAIQKARENALELRGLAKLVTKKEAQTRLRELLALVKK